MYYLSSCQSWSIAAGWLYCIWNSSEVTAQDYKLILLGFVPSSVCGSQWNKEYYSNSKLPKALRTETKQGTQNCRALGIGEKTLILALLCYCVSLRQCRLSQTHWHLPFAAAVQGHLSITPSQGCGGQPWWVLLSKVPSSILYFTLR